ncbi:MAG TPA: hypothetical protein VNR65_01520 [Geobacterales bacterium]|nr:hypothetical protein [Geobacterales bacterium]
MQNSLEDLGSSVPKVNGVVLASRYGKDNNLSNHGHPDDQALIHRDDQKWGRSFETGLTAGKRSRKLFPSILSYLAIAILSGGISGGALLYFLLHYAVPHDTETSTALSSAPGVGEGETSDRPVIERSLSFTPVSKAVSLPQDGVERQNAPTGNAGGPSLPAELNRKAVEVMDPTGILPATTGPDAKEPDAGSKTFASTGADAKQPDIRRKTAAIAPVEEPTPAAPMPALVPAPKDLQEGRPPASDKADPGVTKRDTQLPKLSAEQEDKMLKRASTLLGENDIAGARLIFHYLANHGSAGGAFALAESYDPKKWGSHRVTGMAPDGDLARNWYARAAELGSREAVAILRKEKP